MAIFRDCIGPTWLNEPLSLEETASRFIPSALQQTFVDLCRQPVSHYLDRWVTQVRHQSDEWGQGQPGVEVHRIECIAGARDCRAWLWHAVLCLRAIMLCSICTMACHLL